MRLLVALLPCFLLIGCTPRNTTMEWYETPKPQASQKRLQEKQKGLEKFELPIDDALYDYTAARCPKDAAALLERGIDSAKKVRTRWKQLNCFYSNVQGRSLVVFLDGTGNTQKSNTNIWRLYNLSLLRAMQGNIIPNSSTAIIPYYDRGVGTDFRAVTGNIFGAGVSGNIRQAYRFLVETYKPGDKIFLFGFSRGAFTARSLNGMIEFAGLAKLESIQPNTIDSLPLGSVFGNFHRKATGLFGAYKHLNTGKSDFNDFLRREIEKYKNEKGIETYPKDSVKVEAIGVFDTVPAVGFTRNDDPDRHRLELYAKRGFHAMSLDEQRNDFRLLRFAVPDKPGQRLEEIWLPGVHSDVGGGYAKQAINESCVPQGKKHLGLEGISLSWMLNRFSRDRIFPDNLILDECMSAELHDEYFTEKRIRRLVFKAGGVYRRRPVECDSLHSSVIDRASMKLTKNHPERERDGKYAPSNIGYAPTKSFCVLDSTKTRDACTCTGSSPSTTVN